MNWIVKDERPFKVFVWIGYGRISFSRIEKNTLSRLRQSLEKEHRSFAAIVYVTSGCMIILRKN